MLPFFGDNEFFSCAGSEIYFEDGLHLNLQVLKMASLQVNLQTFKPANLQLNYKISSVASFATRTKSSTVGTLRIIYPMLP